MIALIGSLSVLLGLASAVWLAITGFRTGLDPRRLSQARKNLFAPTAGILIGGVGAMAALEAALLANDFSLKYLAENHSRATPFPFNVATAWAALEGSIVLWGLVLAGYTWFVYRRVGRDDPMGTVALGVMGIVAAFFFGMMATVANPFQTVSPVPTDGPGPNPLLQNHLMMAIHPPLLYLGFVGFTVPFAFGIAALLLGETGASWLERTRRSSLLAWSFLTAGIVVGGWWSYEVLGWGGFWAWDPVENASFMPWLLGTAFIHSSVVQRRRGMLQAWNFSLVIATFAFTILGTFITRSGIIGSVHSFTQSAVGPVLLSFLTVVLVGSFGLLAARLTRISTPPRLDALTSREGVFLANNLLLTTLVFVVLVGTMYPVVLEALTGDRVSVGRPFFDRFAVPLSYALLVAMAIGPLTPWRVARPSVMWRRVRLPLRFAAFAGLIPVVAGVRVPHVVLVAMIAGFVIGATIVQLWQETRARLPGVDGATGKAVLGVLRSDPGFWGGQMSHVGVVLVATAIALYGNLSVGGELTMTPGQTVEFGGYRLTYLGSFTRPEPNRTVIGARIEVNRDGKPLEVLEPRVNRYPTFQQPIGTPAVRTGLTHDLYLSLRSMSENQIILEADVFPYMWWLWLGGFITAVGATWGLVSRRKRERSSIYVTAV